MNASGWMLMVLSVGGATGFFAWCLWKVLRTPQSTEHMHSPVDIQPPDRE